MPRRTIHITESTESLVRDLAEEGESFSAAIARLVEAGAAASRGKRMPSYIGIGEGPSDLGRRAEDYLKELFSEDFKH
jgi:hypothetical protein